jgi:beta-glucosidase
LSNAGLASLSRRSTVPVSAGLSHDVFLERRHLPQTLQDRHGGWQSAETVKAFGEYAGYLAEKLTDRVRRFFTINEFNRSKRLLLSPCTSSREALLFLSK